MRLFALVLLLSVSQIFAQPYTPINRGRLQTDMDANGFAITNQKPGSVSGYIVSTNGFGTNTTFYGTTGTNIITVLDGTGKGIYYFSNSPTADCGEQIPIWTNSSGNGWVVGLDLTFCADGVFELDDSLADILNQNGFNWRFENQSVTSPIGPWVKVRNVAGTAPMVSFFGKPGITAAGPIIGDGSTLTNISAGNLSGVASNSILPNPMNVGQINATNLLVNGNAAFSNPPFASAINITNLPIHSFALASQAPFPPLICSTFRDLFLANVLPSESFVKSNVDFLFTNGIYLFGYSNIAIDDAWQSFSGRTPAGNLLENATNFPSGFTNLFAYIHSKGMNIHLYSSFGTFTCANYPPQSANPAHYPATDTFHAAQDVRQFGYWGVDAFNSDTCGQQLDLLGIAMWRQYLRAIDNAIMELPQYTGRTNRMQLHISPGNTPGLFSWNIPYEANVWYDGYGYGGAPLFNSIQLGVALVDYQASTGWRSATSSGPGHYADLVSDTARLEPDYNNGNLLDVGIASSGGASTLTDASKTWNVNAYVGMAVSVTNGTSFPDRRIVTANTSSQLTVTPAWSATPDNTTRYVIYDTPTNVLAAQQSFIMALGSGQHGQSFFTLPTYQFLGGPMAVWQWNTNYEVQALNFDPACLPGFHVSNPGAPADTATIVRPLGGWTTGTNAVLLANWSGAIQNITVPFGICFSIPSNNPVRIRDRWAHVDTDYSQNYVTLTVPNHHVSLFTFETLPIIQPSAVIISNNYPIVSWGQFGGQSGASLWLSNGFSLYAVGTNTVNSTAYTNKIY